MVREQLSNSCGRSNYKYPAPVIKRVSVADLTGNKHPNWWPGLIDTGADVSVVPLVACQDLGLQPRDWAQPRGFDLQPARERIPVYYVRIQIDGVGDFSLKAFAVRRESLLIGRDLLPGLVLLLDNEAACFKLGRHSGWTRLLLGTLKLR